MANFQQGFAQGRQGFPSGGYQQGQNQGQWNAMQGNFSQFPHAATFPGVFQQHQHQQHFHNQQQAFQQPPHHGMQPLNQQQLQADDMKKRQFEEQKRRLQEFSTRGGKGKAAGGKNVDDLLNKTDLSLSATGKGRSGSLTQSGNNIAPRSFIFGGSNIGATEKQAMNTSQQPIPKPDEFSAFQVGNVQSFSSSSASTSFSASFQVSNTQANFPLPSGFSNQKQPNVTADDDFGDFQVGGNSNMFSSVAASPNSSQPTSSMKSLDLTSSIASALTAIGQPPQAFTSSSQRPDFLPTQVEKQQAAGFPSPVSFPSGSDQSSPTYPQADINHSMGLSFGNPRTSTGLTISNVPGFQDRTSNISSQGYYQQPPVSSPIGQQPPLNVGQEIGMVPQQPFVEFGNTQEEDTTDDPNSPEKLYGSSLPVWCSESASLPAVYKKILYLSLAFDGSIDTNKLYKLLLSSNVSKERLRDIWEIANKRTPGVLVEQELYLVLGLVALTQAGWSKLSIQKLCACKTAPIPEFPEYIFMDKDDSSVFGENVDEIQELDTLEPEQPVDPNDKYSVFRSLGRRSRTSSTVSGGSTHDVDHADIHAISAAIPTCFQVPSLGPLARSESSGQTSTSAVSAIPGSPDWANFQSQPMPTSTATNVDNFAMFSDPVASTTTLSNANLTFPNIPSTLPSATTTQQSFASFPNFPAGNKASTSNVSPASNEISAALTGLFSASDNSSQDNNDFGDVLFKNSTESTFKHPVSNIPNASLKDNGLNSFTTFDSLKSLEKTAVIGPSSQSLGQSNQFTDHSLIMSLPSPSNQLKEAAVSMDDSWDDFASCSFPSQSTFFEASNIARSPSFETKSDILAGKPFKDGAEIIRENLTQPNLFQTSNPENEVKFDIGDTFGKNSVDVSFDKNSVDISLDSQFAKARLDDPFQAAQSEQKEKFDPGFHGGFKSEQGFGNFRLFDMKGSSDLESKQLDAFSNLAELKMRDKNSKPSADNFDAFHSSSAGSVPLSTSSVISSQFTTQVRKKPEYRQDVPIQTALDSQDRYKALTGELEDTERHVHEWKKCLTSIYNSFNNTAALIRRHNLSTDAKKEIFENEKGKQFFHGLKEIYAVALRIRVSVENSALAKGNSELVRLLQQIDALWREICLFTSGFPKFAMAEVSNLFQNSSRQEDEIAAACGVCLLDVNNGPAQAKELNLSLSNLTYGGKLYHATCANFWCNKVNSVLPALPPLSSGLL